MGPAPVAEGPSSSTTRFQFDRSGTVAPVEATGARYVLFQVSLGERVKKAAMTVTTLKAPVAIRFAETAQVFEDRVLNPLVREPADLAQASLTRTTAASVSF